LGFHILRQPPAARDHEQTVEVKKGKASEANAFDDVTGLLEQRANLAAIKMLAVPNVPVKGRHGAGRNGNNQFGVGRQILPRLFQESGRIIDMFQDLGTNCVRGPAFEIIESGWRMENVGYEESGLRNFPARHGHAAFAQLSSEKFRLRQKRMQFLH
jgi:hypothetical protein